VSRFHSYISSALQIISKYNGNEPLASFSKKYFAANKKFGGKDRKAIMHLCYCWFRLGNALKETETEERMLLGLFLGSQIANEVLQFFKPVWNEAIELPVTEKLKLLTIAIKDEDVFPFVNELSNEIAVHEFSFSHFIQPSLFLRLRPGQQQTVISKLQIAGLAFQLLPNDCIALPNATKIEQMIQLNREAVVQDDSSQRVGDLLQIVRLQTSNTKLSVWDCCAASGGKSIMAKDILGDVDLTVSDVRESILVNLKKRFAEAGILHYKSFTADLSSQFSLQHNKNYQLVIADVPCSGSGTWGRTPEQLQFFSAQKINEYAILQKKIVRNIIPSVEQNGYLLYITCSVFRKENEEVVTFIQQESGMQLVEMKLLKGYHQKADTMFAALLKKG
jgi:16S rRNA (cytosine967-C5)-methyltransferase